MCMCELYFPGKSLIPLAFQFGQMEELITLAIQRIITPAAHVPFIINRVPFFFHSWTGQKIFGLKSLCLVNIGRSFPSTYQAADFTIKAFDILPHLISQPVPDFLHSMPRDTA